MSAYFDNADTGAALIPTGQGSSPVITTTDYPFTFFTWWKLSTANRTTESSREFFQMFNETFETDNTNYFSFMSVNSQSDTPTTHTAFRREVKAFGSGIAYDPDWNADPYELDTWTQLIWDVESSSTIRLYANNSVQTVSNELTRNVFNYPTNSDMNELFFMGKRVSEPPSIARYAGMGFIQRQLTSTERTQLQSYWPSSITSLSDGYTWDLNGNLTAGHGSIDLEEKVASTINYDGADNPSISMLAASSGVAGIILGGG